MHKAKNELRDEFARRTVRRITKLQAALAEYFAEMWQDEIDIIQSDQLAAAVAETGGGITLCLNCEARKELDYFTKYNAATMALEKLRERGFKVELDTSDETSDPDPDIYKVWKEAAVK